MGCIIKSLIFIIGKKIAKDLEKGNPLDSKVLIGY